MRVVAGEFKGRKLKTLSGKNTRPTTDKVKGAMFNIIGPYFTKGEVLDLYSGSGSLGIEAVSRGFSHAVLVDQHYGAIQVIRENVKMTKKEEQFSIWKMTDKKALVKAKEEKKCFDLVFLDPPYAKEQINKVIEQLEQLELLADGACIVCETEQHIVLDDHFQTLEKRKEQVYGISKVTIYKKV